jgi:glycerol-3-phosphate acyltransferase PlsY
VYGQNGDTLICILGILFGYLLGSLLPAYFFGQLKKIDITKVGTRNPGTINSYKALGVSAAIPTAIFDCLKGVIAILFAQSIGASFACVQAAGVAAIAGHVFPFYLKFRGGQGVAAAVGILIFYLAIYIRTEGSFLYILGFLSAIFLLFYYVTKKGALTRMIVFPVLCYAAFAWNPYFPYNYWLLVIVAHTELIAIINTRKSRLLRIEDATFKTHWWRVALRPCAVIFVILYLFWVQRTLLVFVGSVALVFITVDIVRFILQQANELFTVRIKHFLKQGESRRFSSMTMFLVAAFIIILVFKKDIAMAALTFLIFGDIFSKLLGLGFGRHKLFEKTVEGSIAYLGGVLICAFILYSSLHMPILMLLAGAVAATIAEFMPLGIDDNFTVGIVSGAVMTVVRTFSA